MKKLALAVVMVAIVLVGYLVINYAQDYYAHNKFETVAAPVDFSQVAGNLTYYAKTSSYDTTAFDGNVTLHTTYQLEYMNGIVVYTYWNNTKGFLVLTGTQQIEQENT